MIAPLAFIADVTLSQTFPHLFMLYKSAEEIVNRPQILSLMNSLVIAIGDIISEETSEPLLNSYKEDILLCYFSGLSSADTEGPALEGLKRLVEHKDVLTDEDRMQIIDKLNEMLERDGGDDGASRFVSALSFHSRVLSAS